MVRLSDAPTHRAAQVGMKKAGVIEYGNPDGGSYDLKQANQVLLRSEAWIGWGILDANAFCLVCKDGTPIVTG